MSKISTSKFPVGDDTIIYAEDVYLVFHDNGQGEFIIPNIEKYLVSDGVKVDRGQTGKVDLFCPNVKVLKHKYNQWSRVDDNIIECSECGAKMDISKAKGVAKIEEVK